MKKPKSTRIAGVMNTVWPGAGQIYLGQFRLGIVLGSAFGLCFLLAAGIFLRAMMLYFEVATNGRIMEDGQLEKLGDSIHKGWLIGLMAGGVGVWLISLATLRPPPEGDPDSRPPAPPILPPPLPKAPPN